MKTCSGCNIPQPLDSFHRHAGTRDGRTQRCKRCRRNEEHDRYYLKQRANRLVRGGPASSWQVQRDVAMERFWSFVAKSEEGCWLWHGPKSDDGYGVIQLRTVARRRVRAHRISWLFTHGSLPDDLFVCHKCDTPLCVRPDHLFLGTAMDNNRDARMKGRDNPEAKVCRGVANGRAKLTAEQVNEIRCRYVPWSISLPTLGREYGVSAQVIHSIITGKTWRHV